MFGRNLVTRGKVLLVHIAIFVTLTGCSEKASEQLSSPIEPSEWFEDITAESGLNFQHHSGVEGHYLLPEIMGAGAAIFDADNDGRLDIYLISGGPDHEGARNRLFRQTSDGKFTDVTTQSGLGDHGFGMGAAVGDIDNDGDLDLLVTNYGDDRLYRNDGHGTFSDITGGAGIKGARWSTSATFCDIDNDDHLDLYISTYVTNDPPFACTSGVGEIDYCGPNAYRGLADQLYRNNGDGTFTDISVTSGIADVVNNGLGVLCFDFNKDSHDDFLIANDGERNQLWINDGTGRFNDRGVASGIAVNIFGETEASMGIAFGDVNGDLGLDIFLTHLNEESNTLYLSTQRGALMDTTATSGLGITSVRYTGFGTALFDADHDGDLDLAIANGRVRKSQDSDPGDGSILEQFHHFFAESNQLMENTGTGHFQDFCDRTGQFCESLAISRGLLTVDIDRDGDLDLLLTNSNGAAQLYRNNIPKMGNWLMLRVLDHNRDAIGALAAVRTGDTWQIRPVIHSYSYLSSSDATVHFGLGTANSVDEIEITWPDGVKERFAGGNVNQLRVIDRGAVNTDE